MHWKRKSKSKPKKHDKLGIVTKQCSEPRSYIVKTENGEHRRNRRQLLQVNEPKPKFRKPEEDLPVEHKQVTTPQDTATTQQVAKQQPDATTQQPIRRNPTRVRNPPARFKDYVEK